MAYKCTKGQVVNHHHGHCQNIVLYQSMTLSVCVINDVYGLLTYYLDSIYQVFD